MRIYIDFDDVLCETARALAMLAKEMFGRDVPYEDITFFNLQKSFSLSDEQIAQLMERAHEYDFLLGLEPTPGAVEAVRSLVEHRLPACASGAHRLEACAPLNEVVIVTGRQPTCHAASVAWLRKHGLGHLEIVYVDKYGRALECGGSTPLSPTPTSLPAPQKAVSSHRTPYLRTPPLLSVADFNKLHFDIAIDDSPDALDLLAPRTDCHTIIFDRPWNRAYPTYPTMSRAHSWEEIKTFF